MQNFMYRLIEKAGKKSASRPKIVPPKLKNEHHPDITISRDPGSGGKLVAQKIAKKLGWKFFDKTLMIKVANELGIPAREFSNVDEHTRGWMADTIQSLLNPNYVSDVKYIVHMKKILLHAAEDSQIVVLGRGADRILDPSMCLRVRITASFSTRVKNTVAHEGKSKEEAAKWVEHVESKRANFIRQYFGINPYNSWNYDLVVNTDNLSLEQASEMIIQAYLAKFPAERKLLKKKLS